MPHGRCCQPQLGKSNAYALTEIAVWEIAEIIVIDTFAFLIQSGIVNVGSTCYFSCLLQILKTIVLECPDFLIGLSEGQIPFPNPGYFLAGVLDSLVYAPDPPCMGAAAVDKNKSRLVDSLSVGRFCNGEQQDPQEVMCFLLDAIHEQHFLRLQPFAQYQQNPLPRQDSADYQQIASVNAKKALASLQEPVTKLPRNLFGIGLEEEVTCLACGAVSSKNTSVETFLPFPTSNATGLHDMLTQYFNPTTVTDKDCEHCPCKEASIKVCVTHFPEILTIQFGRFSNDNKDTRRLTFPTRIVARDGITYDLIAYVSHEGQSVNDGHYYARAKRGGQWYSFNDMAVTSWPEPDESMESNNVYLLYYKLRAV